MSALAPAPRQEANREVEIKLLAESRAALRALTAHEHFGAFRLRPRGAARLSTTYLDTPQRTLLANALALRLRQRGRAWEATLKWAGKVRRDVHTRREINLPLSETPPLPFVLPAGILRDELFAYVLDRPLQPLLTTQIHRQLFDLVDDEHDTVVAELALDTVRHGRDKSDLREPYFEVEVEQRAGSLDDLEALALLLRDEHHLIPTAESKFLRAQRDVLGARQIRPLAPIDRTDTWLGAARKIAAAQLARLRANDPRVRAGADPDPEAIHQMRVATRRLRSMFQLFADGIPETTATQLANELQWLGATLGAARDLDVQLAQWESVRRPGDPTDPLVAQFFRDLAVARAPALAELRTALESARYVRLLRRLERFAAPAFRPSRRPAASDAGHEVAPAAARALTSAQRAVRKQAKRALRQTGARAFHRLRIRCRRLRYLLEFLSPLLDENADWLIARLTFFQDLLGEANDRIILAYRLRLRTAGPDLSEPQRAALHANADELLLGAGSLHEQFRGKWDDEASRIRKRIRRIAHLLADVPNVTETPIAGTGM